jgi:hypothetical protein
VLLMMMYGTSLLMLMVITVTTVTRHATHAVTPMQNLAML